MVDVHCPDDCDGITEYEFDDDPSGKHVVHCESCNKEITFEIEFDPVAVNETTLK